MSNNPNKIKEPNETQRNIIITVLIILILLFSVLILYLLFSKKEIKKFDRMPYIELYGDTVIVLNKGDAYVDYGYYAYDLEDGNLTNKVGIQTEIDNTKPGIYTITYIANDTNKQSAVKTRTAVVKTETHSFDFYLKGSNLVYLKKGNRFTEPGFNAYVNDTSLNDTVKVFGEVDSEKNGIYTLYYVVENNKEVAVLTRKIIVSDELSYINLTDDELKYISNYNIKELQNNYKTVPEHFTSKTKLILAFSLCQNDGKLSDSEIGDCLATTFDLKGSEISHVTKYNLANGIISYHENTNNWSVAYNSLIEQLEANLKSLNETARLKLEDEENVYIFVENNDVIYKYVFEKTEANYKFVAVDII